VQITVCWSCMRLVDVFSQKQTDQPTTTSTGDKSKQKSLENDGVAFIET